MKKFVILIILLVCLFATPVAMAKQVHDVSVFLEQPNDPFTGLGVINYSVTNLGNNVENAIVTIVDSTDSVILCTESVYINSGETYNSICLWDTFNSSVGDHTVTLTVEPVPRETNIIDNSDTAIIVITAMNNPPIAYAGIDQSAIIGATVYFDASDSSDDNGITLYEWDFESDGIYDVTGITASHIYNTEGANTVTLRVTDTGNQTDLDTAIVTITAPDYPPVADAGVSYSAYTGYSIKFEGFNSTDDNGIVLYEWDFESDGIYDSTKAFDFHTYYTAGIYTVTLRVTDTIGQTDTDTAIVTITDIDSSPVADAGPDQSAYAGDTVFFNGNGSTDDNGIVLYEWDFDSDSIYDATGIVSSYVYNTAGDYTATLRVTDDIGQTSTDIATISIVESGTPPVANAGPDQSVLTEQTVNFDGSGSTGIIELYEWDFESDGIYDVTGVTAIHTYNTVGAYTATLRVTDNIGQSNTDTVIIDAIDNPPVADAGPDLFDYTGGLVIFRAVGSYDDHDIVLYEWDIESDGIYDFTGKLATHTFYTPGIFNVTLRVTDTIGQTDIDTTIVTITALPIYDGLISSLTTDNPKYVKTQTVYTNTIVDNTGNQVLDATIRYTYLRPDQSIAFTEDKTVSVQAGSSANSQSSYTLPKQDSPQGIWTLTSELIYNGQTLDTKTTIFEVVKKL